VELDELGVLLGVEDLDARLERVEHRIAEALRLDDPWHHDALVRVASAGGKRLRPALAIACAALLGTWDDRVVDVAAAVELVQIGSLVHDDIIDAAETRRGTPTINAVEGDEVAIVAGDLVLARAGQLGAGVSGEAGVVVNATIARLCAGQFAEMADLYDPTRTIERHLGSVAGKTAALFESSCRLGAMCADAPQEVVEALARFGHAFGMAFQLLDDVLDLIGDAERLGKPVAVDIAAGVYTLPVLHALSGAGGEELRALLSDDPDSARVRVLASGGVDAARTAMAGYAAEATAALDPVATNGVHVDGVRAFPTRYLEWALARFSARP
jgi:geranylgeranyl pyrophosphate synthase